MWLLCSDPNPLNALFLMFRVCTYKSHRDGVIKKCSGIAVTGYCILFCTYKSVCCICTCSGMHGYNLKPYFSPFFLHLYSFSKRFFCVVMPLLCYTLQLFSLNVPDINPLKSCSLLLSSPLIMCSTVVVYASFQQSFPHNEGIGACCYFMFSYFYKDIWNSFTEVIYLHVRVCL